MFGAQGGWSQRVVVHEYGCSQRGTEVCLLDDSRAFPFQEHITSVLQGPAPPPDSTSTDLSKFSRPALDSCLPASGGNQHYLHCFQWAGPGSLSTVVLTFDLDRD